VGEFAGLSQICGNETVPAGSDGDSGRENRSTGFLRPLYTDDVLGLKFTISGKEDTDGGYGSCTWITREPTRTATPY